MEVNGGAGKHPHPRHHNQIQGHVQQVEEGPERRRHAGFPQEGHRGRLLHDEQGGVGQDERVSRDVAPLPVETGPPAGGFGSELAGSKDRSFAFKANARHVLDVEEGLRADVPDSRRHRQGQQAFEKR